MEAINETLTHVLVDHCVSSDVVFPLSFLVRRWKLTVKKQVCHFEIRRALGELFDGVSAVAKNAFVAVEVCDCRRA